ncbi:transport permease protein [Sinisalibacter aestuarii]|uniref:Transport permease protein n=1 Tax=Sinisalibacter aestuarii TaxID=2949426 RepID=A0ABQ5LNH1_9RHOB|nr:transport permease protein [Sinisalibacter aestuarii]
MSSMDSADTTSQIAPALEPPKAIFDEHRRSFATARVILALVLREMSTQYGRSPGGYIWAILEPIGMIVILSVGFSLLVRMPSLGNGFVLFYASAYLVFSHYKSIEKATNKAIAFSRPLLFYPAVTWLDALLARIILNTLTNLLNMILIIGGVIFLFAPGIVPYYPPMIEAVALATLLGVGVGTLNCFLMGVSPLYTTLWKMATRPLMIASGVLYIMEDLPDAARDVLWWNPLIHITAMFRTGIYPYYHAQFLSPMYVVAIGLGSFAIGLLFLNSYNKNIINNE